MHLHGLKLLIVVCIILGQIPKILSLGEKSPRTYFKEVADFDDIVEETDKRDENKKVTFTNNVTMVPDSAGIFPQARVKQDVNFIEIQEQSDQNNQDQVKPENLEISPQNIGIYPQFIYPQLQYGQRVNTFRVENQADQVEQVTQTDEIKLETVRIFHQSKGKERVNAEQIQNQADQTDKFNEIEPKIIFTKKLGQPKTYRKKTKLNKFDRPELYVIRKIPSPRGYLVMKNKQKNYLNEDLENQGKRVKSNINRYHPEEPVDVLFPFKPSIETVETTLQSSENPENEDSNSCNILFQLFQEIPIINDMLKELVEGKPTKDINTTWKTIKCVIKQQPDNSQKDLIDKPEGKICFRKFIRNHRRRRRHSTYLNFRNKRKRINNSLAKRNVEDDPRFKSIIDFIVKNKIFLDKYTYVPIVFSKITQDKNEGQMTGSINNNQSTTLSAEQLAKISCAECSNQEVESTEIPSSTASKRGVLSPTEIPIITTEQRDFSPFASIPNRATYQRNSSQLLLSPPNPNVSNISDIVQYIFSELPRDINKQEYYFTPHLYSQQIPISNTSHLKNVVEPTRQDDTISNNDNSTSEENDKTSDTSSIISETFTNPTEKTTDTVNMINETFTEQSDKASDTDNMYQVFTLPVKREDNVPKISVSCIPSTLVPSPPVSCIPSTSVPSPSASCVPLSSISAAPLSAVAVTPPASAISPPVPVLSPPAPAVSPSGLAINSLAPIIPLQTNISGNPSTATAGPIQNAVLNKDSSGSSTPFIVIGRRNISEDIYFKLPDFKRTINQTAKILKDSAGCRKRNVRGANNCESSTPLIISELRNMSEEILFKIPNLKRDLQNNETIPNLQSVNRLKKDVDSEEYEEFEESDVGRNPDKRTANDTTTEEPIKLQLTENLGTTCIPVTALLSNTTGSGRNHSSNETILKINETLVPSEAMPTENTNLGEMFVFEKSTETNNDNKNNSNTSTVKIDNNTTTIEIKNNSNISTLNNNTGSVDIKSTMNISTVTIINTGVTDLKTTEICTNNTKGPIGLNKTSDTGPSEMKSANIVGAAKSDNSTLTINMTSSNKTSNLSQNITTTTTGDKHMIPGVLIYPINENEKPQQPATKAKRSIFEETDLIDTFTYTNSALNEIESITIEDPLLNINRKYIDFNPLIMMKKEAKIDSNETNCQKETEMILDTLKSLNLNPPSEASSQEAATIPPTSAYNDQSNFNTPTVSNMNMNNFNVNPTAASNPSGFSQPNFAINANLQPVQVSWQVSPNLSPNMGLGESNMPVMGQMSVSKSETPSTTVSTSISSPPSTAAASTTVSTVGSSAQGDEASASANTMTSSADYETDSKLEKLEKDLRLVNEVQNIIDGMYRMKHKVRKRAVVDPFAIDPQMYKTLIEPKMHITSPVQHSNVNPEKLKEVSGLGKILKWKYLKNKHRKKRRLRRKKRRKYKRLYPYRHRRFLGLRMQNSS